RVTHPVAERQVAVFVERTAVATVEPQVAKGGQGLLRRAPVTVEHRVRLPWTSDDLAFDAGGERPVAFVVAGDLQVVDRLPHRAPGRRGRPGARGQAQSGGAVDLGEMDCEAFLPRLDELRRSRRAERDPSRIVRVVRTWRLTPQEQDHRAEVAEERAPGGA